MSGMFNLAGWQRRLGVVGMAGIGLLLLALVGYLLAVLPQQKQAQSLVLQLLQAHSAPVKAVPVEDALSRSDKLYDSIPSIVSLPLWLETLHKMADEQGLQLIQGEYKLSADQDGRVMRYQILLPVRGSYPQVRHFVENATKFIPSLGLSEIDLKRETVAENQVEARLSFILLLLK